MGCQFIDVEQGSLEWKQARAGIPTASRFSDVMAKGEGKVRGKYLRQLAGELVTGEPMETYSNDHMIRGKEREAEAREKYAFLTGTQPQLVGFAVNGIAGCSPDSLVGEDGMLEIKTLLPDLLIEQIMKPDDYLPPEHRHQCQGGLWVTGRKWCDLAMYARGMPLLIRRWHRDEGFIATLVGEVRVFRADLAAMVDRVKGMRG